MSTVRDHVSDIPVRTRLAANRVHVGASNAWYRAAGRRIHGTRTAMSNARNKRTIERGRPSRYATAKTGAAARTPVLRSRINPATGRPRRDEGSRARAGRIAQSIRDENTARPGPESAVATARKTRTWLAASPRDRIRGLDAYDPPARRMARSRAAAPARARETR